MHTYIYSSSHTFYNLHISFHSIFFLHISLLSYTHTKSYLFHAHISNTHSILTSMCTPCTINYHTLNPMYPPQHVITTFTRGEKFSNIILDHVSHSIVHNITYIRNECMLTTCMRSLLTISTEQMFVSEVMWGVYQVRIGTTSSSQSQYSRGDPEPIFGISSGMSSLAHTLWHRAAEVPGQPRQQHWWT
jgi:hypothetical protein